MALMPKDYIVNIQIKDKNKLLDKLAELIGCYDELLDLIPEWNNIEAREAANRISILLSDLLEVKSRK